MLLYDAFNQFVVVQNVWWQNAFTQWNRVWLKRFWKTSTMVRMATAMTISWKLRWRISLFLFYQEWFLVLQICPSLMILPTFIIICDPYPSISPISETQILLQTQSSDAWWCKENGKFYNTVWYSDMMKPVCVQTMLA